MYLLTFALLLPMFMNSNLAIRHSVVIELVEIALEVFINF